MSQALRPVRRTGAAAVLLALAACQLAAQQPSPPPACPGCPEAGALIRQFGLRESGTPVRERVGWQAPRRIVTTGDASWAAALRQAAPGAEVIVVSDYGDVPAALAGADVYIGFCSPAVVAAGTSLKWIQLLSAGADSCASVPGVSERNILLTNAQSLLGPPVADHAMALLLTLTRGLAVYHEQQRNRQWSARDGRALPGGAPWELDGKTMLVIGLGGIGSEIARRSYGFGMHVKGTRNSRREAPEYVEYVGLANEAQELARGADVVVNAAPLTSATRGMFNAAFFRAMKRGALFINIGRGESVVTQDLVQALQDGTIGGAGLDVTDPEPLPADHALWGMRNVVITPHIAGGSDRLDQRRLAVAVENLRRYASGGRMLSVVDVARGY